MMKSFRKLGETKPAKFLLGVLAISFAAWGVGDYLVHQLGGEAMTINGEGISVGQVQRDYDGALKRVQQMLGGQPVPPALLAKLNVPQQVTADVVHRTVLRQQAGELALIPSTAQMRDEITQIPAFQQNGAFNLSRYQQTLAGNGMSTSEFEHELGHDLSVRLFSQLIQVPSPTVVAVRPLSSLAHATLTLNVLTLTPASLPPAPAITAAELKQFYDANPSLGAVPEKRSFNVLMLDAAEMAKTLSIGDDQVAAEYNAHKADYALPERRRVRHILVNSEVVAKRMAGEIHTLKDLEKAAREHTLDPGSKDNGGDLGLIAKSDVVPAFGDAAFKLPVGGISAPVKSPFGWHIIGVESIEPPHQQTLAEVHDRIAAELRKQNAEQAVSDLANQITDAVAAGDTLDKIASQKGLKLQRYTLIEPGAENPDAAIMQVAFAQPEKQVSDPINLPHNAVGYVQTTTIVPATRRPLAEIHDQVLKAAQQAQIQAGLANTAKAIYAASRTPGNSGLADAARAAKVPNVNVTQLAIGPSNSTPDWLQKDRGDVLALPVNGTLESPIAVGDNQLNLVQLAKRQLGDPTPEQIAATTEAYTKQLQSETEQMVMDKLAQASSIKINADRMRSVFGPSYTMPF
jgi:peptidyl-prolyl cis-trans isomerase D